MKNIAETFKNVIRYDLLAGFMSKRSSREQLMILAFGGLLLASLDYALWFNPVMNVLLQTAPKLSAAETELTGLRDDKKNEELIKARHQNMVNELANLEKGLEAANQIPALLEDLSQMASKAGVRITSLTPVESEGSAGGKLYQAQLIEMKASAGAHELGNFLNSLETGSILFRIKDISINQNPQNPKKHLIEIKMETFKKV